MVPSRARVGEEKAQFLTFTVHFIAPSFTA